MRTLTVFTPSFNRAHLLPRLYGSLQNQSNFDFLWMIIDDGSEDSTKELVEQWQNSNANFEIVYIFQENQGMHGAHNTAYQNITTAYNVCIDSDDYMPARAVETIIDQIKNLTQEYAGIVGLDAEENSLEVIGTKIPNELQKVKLNELYSIHKVKGDKKLVYKTEIVKKYPAYPLFENERFVPLDYLYLLIDQDYYLKPVNEVLCIVEYQNDGSSKNILRQYVKNPNGFAFSRLSRIKYGKTFNERFRNAIHLVSSSFFAKDFSWLFKSNRPSLILLAFPFGVLLNFYIRIKK